MHRSLMLEQYKRARRLFFAPFVEPLMYQLPHINILLRFTETHAADSTRFASPRRGSGQSSPLEIPPAPLPPKRRKQRVIISMCLVSGAELGAVALRAWSDASGARSIGFDQTDPAPGHGPENSPTATYQHPHFQCNFPSHNRIHKNNNKHDGGHELEIYCVLWLGRRCSSSLRLRWTGEPSDGYCLLSALSLEASMTEPRLFDLNSPSRTHVCLRMTDNGTRMCRTFCICSILQEIDRGRGYIA